MSRNKGIYERYVKRILDISLAVTGLLILSPVMFGTAVFVRYQLGSPVIFRQARPGRNGEIFYIYKFRTMTEQKNQEGMMLPDEMRLTEFGKMLRSTSLDELPELINIIRGDMSLVGPRPLLVKYLPLYSERQARRHEVRPGLTGYAQVSGRNLASWEEKLEKDVWYVEHLSFWNDIKIVWKTIQVVLKREGISSETSATMEEFKGSS